MCIKFLGVCLCPRCFAEKEKVLRMGTSSDMMTRKHNLRVGDNNLHKKIHKARHLIFKYGASISGVRVKDLLQDESLVPTYVCGVNAIKQRAKYVLECFF